MQVIELMEQKAFIDTIKTLRKRYGKKISLQELLWIRSGVRLAKNKKE